MRYGRLFFCGFCILLGIGFLVREQIQLKPDGHTHVWFLDADVGDSTIVKTGSGKIIVIDGGGDTTLLGELGTVLPFFSRHIDLLILTRPDARHIVSLPPLLERYDIRKILLTAEERDSHRYDALKQLITEKHIPVLIAGDTKNVIIDDLKIDVLWPQVSVAGEKTDDSSMVLRFTSPIHSLLLSGALPQAVLKSVLQSNTNLHAEMWKIPYSYEKLRESPLAERISATRVISPVQTQSGTVSLILD